MFSLIVILPPASKLNAVESSGKTWPDSRLALTKISPSEIRRNVDGFVCVATSIGALIVMEPGELTGAVGNGSGLIVASPASKEDVVGIVTDVPALRRLTIDPASVAPITTSTGSRRNSPPAPRAMFQPL
jgi:hypothetical protein